MNQTTEAPSPLDLRLFGSLQVQVQGQPLPPLRSRKGQYLLALLILRHDRPVERAWLAGTLWPESSEEQARFNLRQCLSNLRQALGPEGSRLLSPTPHALSLDLTGASADVVEFDREIARGDVTSLQQAVTLYRGPLLEGCTEEWALPERQAREQAYLGALERLAQSALAQGEPQTAVGYLRQVVAVDPLRESAQRGLMQALAASGDDAAVILAYRELRLLLRRELNADPDPQTTALFEQLRQQARQRIQTSVRELPAPVSFSSPAAVMHNLPVAVTSFIGREQEIEEVRQVLSRNRLLTLTGAGGCGKTRLALQVAELALQDYPDGVWLVELAALSDASLLPQTLASTLKLREGAGSTYTQVLLEHLKTKKALLLLDNCEHLVGACAALVYTLLRACPHLKVLATSRETLQIAAEQRWRVPPLAHPTENQSPAEEKEIAGVMLEYDACRLFVERARVQQPEFALTRMNAGALGQLCRHLDGLPLALELAAARMRVLSLEQIVDRLEDRFRLLRGTDRTALPRHQTLRGLIDWSYDLLTSPEQLLFHRLSVFAGGFSLEAAECVCGADEGVGCWVLGVGEEPVTTSANEMKPGTQKGSRQLKHLTPNTQYLTPNTDEVLDWLTCLVDKSLVVVDRTDQGIRYRLLETIRQYAAEKLEASGEAEVVRQRHGDYFLQLAEAAAPQLMGKGQQVWLPRLQAEHANLRAALDWSLHSGKREKEKGEREEEENRLSSNLKSQASSLSLAGVLGKFWDVFGYWSEGRHYLQVVLSQSDPSERTSCRARALNALGWLEFRQGDYQSACASYEQAQQISREIGDRVQEAASLNGLGTVDVQRGEYTPARAYLEQARQINREIGDRPREAANLHNLGNVALHQRDYATARAYLVQARQINREIGNRTAEASNFNLLGFAAMDQEDFAGARSYLEQALAMNRELGNRANEAYNLCYLGNTAMHTGDHAAACAYLEQALQICREIGDRSLEATSLHYLGNTLVELGELEQGKWRLRQCLQIRWGLEERAELSFSFESLASLLARQDHFDLAVRLMGAAAALREHHGFPLPPVNQADVERFLSSLRSALTEEGFSSAWEQGQAMPLEQVIACALKQP